MLFKILKINTLLALLAISSNGFNIYSQQKSDISIYKWFDTEVGKENLALNNGSLHSNPYKTIDGTNMYYVNDKYTLGNVCYDGQTYYDVKLKYALFKDELLLNPFGESEYIGIILIQDKIESFSINGKNFVKINKDQSSLTDFVTGYYEVHPIGENFIFYIKHIKDIHKRLDSNGLYYNFTEENQFFIKYKTLFYQINRKSDIFKIFPEYKKQINAFYSTNRKILKSDKNQFMENLLKHIDKFQTNTSQY